MKPLRRRLILALLIAATTGTVLAQRGGPLTPEQATRRWEIEKELQSIAIVDRKVMMPMRDGVRLNTSLYVPKNASTPSPSNCAMVPS